jgi:hypothetical protein
MGMRDGEIFDFGGLHAQRFKLRGERLWPTPVYSPRISRGLPVGHGGNGVSDPGVPMSVAGVEIAGIRTLAAVPMLKQDEVVGAITIYRQEVRRSPTGIRAVKNFGGPDIAGLIWDRTSR